MYDSEDEFIMEFKPQERRMQPAVIDMEYIDSESSTISASEVDSDGPISRTPSLLCKLKKPRVLIKKLPRYVLAKYGIKSKKTPLSSSVQPSRSSGRLKGKRIPVGQYLSLHVNKPLDEVLKRNEKLRLEHEKSLKKEQVAEERIMSQKKNMIECNEKLKKMVIGTKAPVRTVHHSRTEEAPSRRQSLHERISATRLKTHARQQLFNMSDVMIRKQMPSNPLPNIVQPIVFNKTNIPLHAIPQANLVVSTSAVNSANAPILLPIGTINPLHGQITQSPHVLPTFITHLPKQQIPTQSVLLETPNTAPRVDFHQPTNSRTFTIQAFKIPHDLSATNSTAVVNSPKVLIINQPSLQPDPLEMARYNTVNKRDLVTEKVNKGVNTPTNTDCAPLESDLEVSDTEKEKEPEVIKRIIYHSKSVQTKFTCSSSICGLVDSDGFNLNCFYCYDIFPLHKWLEFKQHIKLLHHVEEKENETDLNDISNSKSQDYPQESSFHSLNPYKNTPHTSTKYINNKENLASKVVNATDKVCKKLPLEPKLTAQSPSKASRDSPRSLPKGTNKPSKPKQLNQTIVSTKSCLTTAWKDYNSSAIDEVINLDSDDCGSDNNVSEMTKPNLNAKSSRINDMKMVVPTLPHITIKKIKRISPKEPLNDEKSTTSVIKPNNTNLNVRKAKPAAKQLSGNDDDGKPRYFVVKKIIKLPTANAIPNSESEKDNPENSDHCDMAPNDQNEDSVPKPTNGRGIIFGITNTMVVIEFLMRLKTFPELWRSEFKDVSTGNYSESIRKLCSHLNNRFELNITVSEIRLSIQRVKNWYHRTLATISEYDKNPNNSEPYKINFHLYFKILQKFLTSDVRYTNSTCPSSQLQSGMNNNKVKSNATVPKQKICRSDGKILKADKLNNQLATPVTKKSEASKTNPITQPVYLATNDSKQTSEMNAESLLEFDADTLYDNESSDEEVLKEFDETKLLPVDRQKKKRTKTYTGDHKCDLCSKIFKRSCDVKRHRVMHFPPQFECAVCLEKFYFKHWAERCAHIRSKKFKKDQNNSTDTPKPKKVWPKKIFRFSICEVCGASYKSAGALNTHKKDKHLNERHKCVVCNFTALSNWRIVQHQKKRHIVELGTVEELAKKSRARVETKTRFSNEARQEFLWRREMRMQLKPGEIFYGCCKCRILFNSRKEKVLHNKTEHPITETTVICLLCLPNKMLLSNSNSARRHYTDIHKVAWHEIDALVKRTKPIFQLLSKEEIELLKASANYKELLEELLADKKIEAEKNITILEDETIKAVENLVNSANVKKVKEDIIKTDGECSQEEIVCVDGIIDHDYDCEEVWNDHEYANTNGQNNNNERDLMDNFVEYDDEMVNKQSKTELYSNHASDDGIMELSYDSESSDNKTYNYVKNDHEYTQNMDYFVDGELIEESIVVEESIGEVLEEDF